MAGGTLMPLSVIVSARGKELCNDNYRERPATIRLTGGLRGAVLSELQRLPPADTGLVVGYVARPGCNWIHRGFDKAPRLT
jgi:hypothetical protein